MFNRIDSWTQFKCRFEIQEWLSENEIENIPRNLRRWIMTPNFFIYSRFFTFSVGCPIDIACLVLYHHLKMKSLMTGRVVVFKTFFMLIINAKSMTRWVTGWVGGLFYWRNLGERQNNGTETQHVYMLRGPQIYLDTGSVLTLKA